MTETECYFIKEKHCDDNENCIFRWKNKCENYIDVTEEVRE